VHAAAKANGFVEAALFWFVARVKRAEVPFANESGAITCAA